MSKKTWITTAVLVTALTAGTTTLVLADGSHRRGGDDGWRGGLFHEEHAPPDAGLLPRGLNSLTLSADQQTQISGILKDAQAKTETRRDAMRTNNEALRTALTADPVDTAKVQTLADTQGALIAQSIAQQAQVRTQVLAVLTPEQRSQLQQLPARWRPDNGFRRHGHDDDDRRAPRRW